MAKIKVVLGSVDRASVRGLLLSDAGATPALVLQDATGASFPVAVQPGTTDQRLIAALGAVRTWRFVHGGLAAGGHCELTATIDGAAPHRVAFRTLDPAAPSVSIAIASCYYDFFRYGPRYAAALKSYCKHAAFQLLIGDNVYLDIHSRTRDAALANGWRENAWVYLKYFWESDGYGEVLAALPTFTTWDDHEFWNNFPEEQKWLSRSKSALRPSYLEAAGPFLELFQASLNPAPIPGTRSYRIPDCPVVDVFVADVRSQRDRYRDNARMMPAAALADLQSWAANLSRPGLLVLGQPLVIGEGGKNDYNPPAFRAEYDAIWHAIASAPRDVLVVSGDVHHSRALELTLPDGRRAFEVVTSPASHIPTVWTTVTGSYGSQGGGSVEFPVEVKYGGRAVRASRYVFGTDAKNSIALLTLAGGADDVTVGCAFLDLEPGAPAAASKANSGLFASGWRPELARCEAAHLFSLKKRS